MTRILTTRHLREATQAASRARFAAWDAIFRAGGAPHPHETGGFFTCASRAQTRSGNSEGRSRESAARRRFPGLWISVEMWITGAIEPASVSVVGSRRSRRHDI